MWHHDVSFMQKKAELYFLEIKPNSTWLKYLQVKRWTNRWFGLTAFFSFFRLKVKCGGGKQNTSGNSQYWTVVLSQAPVQPVQLASWEFYFPGHWKVEPVIVLMGKIELQLLRSLLAEKYLGPQRLFSMKKNLWLPLWTKQNQATSYQTGPSMWRWCTVSDKTVWSDGFLTPKYVGEFPCWDRHGQKHTNVEQKGQLVT